MRNDNSTAKGTTNITMTLGQGVVTVDELREIKSREGTTTIVVDETTEIKSRGAIPKTGVIVTMT